MQEKTMNYTGTLPVLAHCIAVSQTSFRPVSLLIVQHIKKNTVEFIRLLKSAGFRDITVIGKSYSVDPDALKLMRKYAKVIVPTLAQLERVSYIGLVIKKVISSQPFLCFDLGGHFSKYFVQSSIGAKNLLGIIEETKNGIWFDELSEFSMPILSVAQSHIKKYGEAYFVARAIVRNTENILINDFQESLAGKRILVLGYGMIGSELAPLLKEQARVSVYDVKASLMVKARIQGFDVLSDLSSLGNFDVIIGVTGQYVLKHELTALKQDVVLVNGSTRKREFDFRSVTGKIESEIQKDSYTSISFSSGKTVRLLAHGYPVNFFRSESVPEYVLDLLYAEIFLLGELLIAKKVPPGFYSIEKHFPLIEETVAHAWLSHRSK
ncbi:hypothetical protein HY947_01610 [Candidatus Gottesmanbacteria bacterium]|nr:hypothetical protein [Candidatus Gottesmanbacteria bacterium]